MVTEWFPPQERPKAEIYLMLVYLAGHIFGFVSPTLMKVENVFLFQAVLTTLLTLPLLYIFKVSPESASSMKSAPKKEEYSKL